MKDLNYVLSHRTTDSPFRAELKPSALRKGSCYTGGLRDVVDQIGNMPKYII